MNGTLTVKGLVDVLEGDILLDADKSIYGNNPSGNHSFIKMYNGQTGDMEFGTNFWDGSFLFKTGNSLEKAMEVDKFGVGIGVETKNPNAKLTVGGNVLLNADMSICGGTVTSNRGFIKLYNSQTGDMEFGTNFWNGSFLFKVGNNLDKIMEIDHAGVGIGSGTKDPNALLTVAGKIHCKSVKVTANAGADFVFEENYELPKLSEVERFVKQNKHLPEVPTACEMEDMGYDMGEFQVKLLQKIEELTLYTIEQQKNLNKQQELIEMLQGEVNQLKKQNK